MEDRTANILAATLLTTFTILISLSTIYLKPTKPFFLVLGASVAGLLVTLVWICFRHRFNRRRKILETKLVSESRELRIEYSFLRKVAGVPTKFKLSELEDATDKFHSLIGQGASGSVFKGILTDGTAVAVKRINSSEERGDKEFRSEVSAIANVQHINLVRLLGYCVVQGGPKFLVYDHISNGSLADWIFPKSGGGGSSDKVRGGCLTWYLRYKVAIDVAKALCYLHQDCRSRILHLDVKPENILLNENFRAVVTDFGLSKLMCRDESRIVTSLRGTRGYLAPEWLLENGISEKSDIYSYGMVLLELVGGRRNVRLVEDINGKRKWEYFPKIVNEKMREGKVMEIVDSRVTEGGGGGVDEREVNRLVRVALWCSQENAKLRPSMNMVVDMLGGRVTVDEPPLSPMIIVDILGIDDEPEGGESGRPRFGAVTADQIKNGKLSSISYSYSFSNAMSILSGR